MYFSQVHSRMPIRQAGSGDSFGGRRNLLVWLGGGSLPAAGGWAAPAADVEVLPLCLHACPWGTVRESGGGRGEGKGRGRARGREWGSDSHGSWVPGPGLEWLTQPSGPGSFYCGSFIYSFMHSFIHLCIRSFIHSAKWDRNRDTRGVQPGDKAGDQPGHQPGTPDRFPLTLHNFGHRKWFPEFFGRGRGVEEGRTSNTYNLV